MTPLALEMLIWAHTRESFRDFPGVSCAPQQAIFTEFRRLGVMTPDYKLTPLGRAWLVSIAATPLPVARYADPRTGAVIEASP